MQSAMEQVVGLPLQTVRQICLYSTRGRIWAVTDFIEAYKDVLSEEEEQIIRTHRGALQRLEPGEVPYVLTRTEDEHDGRECIAALRLGARSAIIPELKLKLKGCRPFRATFPSWEIDEDFGLRVVQIPFGVLKGEAVMREILGYCFCCDKGIQPTSIPVAVLEYNMRDGTSAFCLVSRMMTGEERMEARIVCGGITIHQLLRRDVLGMKRKDSGEEVRLIGIEREAYCREKAHLLCGLNFGGAFRGILNSNVGNDVIQCNRFVGLCDYDTLKVIPVPSGSDAAGVRRFTFHAVLEVIKTSLPFIDYMNVEGMCGSGRAKCLSRYYRAHSTLFSLYRKEFLKRALEIGWKTLEVDRYIDEAFRCPLAGELLEELIPNSHTLKNLRSDSWYVPQG
jgi:hypothetical protein